MTRRVTLTVSVSVCRRHVLYISNAHVSESVYTRRAGGDFTDID